MDELRTAIGDLIRRHCALPRAGTAIDGLTLFNCPSPTEPLRSVYEPRLCVVVQGDKRVMLGTAIHDVGATQCLLAAIDLPVTAYVTGASPAEPHLALVLTLDRLQVAAVMADTGHVQAGPDKASGLVVWTQDEDLLAPVLRLLRLLDKPADIPVLRPMIEREILYRLLQGPCGPALAAFAGGEAPLSQIGRATDWIKANFHRPLRIEDLASHAGMSVTSLHRHFKAFTSMTPIAYRREIRLDEARRRLLAGSARAGDVGLAVGYDSPSQFSREYRRAFGRPPTADGQRLRQDLDGAMAAS